MYCVDNGNYHALVAKSDAAFFIISGFLCLYFLELAYHLVTDSLV